MDCPKIISIATPPLGLHVSMSISYGAKREPRDGERPNPPDLHLYPNAYPVLAIGVSMDGGTWVLLEKGWWAISDLERLARKNIEDDPRDVVRGWLEISTVRGGK